MSEDKSHEIFSAVMYKSFNYAFETDTSFKVMMNLLALPTPYQLDLYPHSGQLSEGTYRTPWIRGKVLPTSKLFLNDSVLDDLRTNNQQTINVKINVPESYTQSLISLQEGDGVIPSSNPDSLNELDLNSSRGIFNECTDPCQETFSKRTLQPDQENKDLHLAEELVEVDYLKEFKSHLPTLKTKLSRLRTLPVVDPLLSFSRDGISENTLLRLCEPYAMPPDLPTRDNWTSTVTLEDFSKELINDEHLTLPDIVETLTYEQKDHSGLSYTCSLLMTNPESINDQHSVLETLQKENQDILQVELYKPWTQESLQEGLANTEPKKPMKSPADMEVDLTLSPVPKASHSSICMSTATLTKEPLSPQGQISLVSLKSQREIEMALWTAEKHPTFVERFMLTEPQTHEMTADFQPLSEALMFLKSQEHFCSDEPMLETGVQEMSLCKSGDFTETIRLDIVSSKVDVEEFKKMSSEQDLPIPSIPMQRPLLYNLKRPEQPALQSLSEHITTQDEAKTRLQMQNVSFGHAQSSNPSPETVCNNNLPDLTSEGKQNAIAKAGQLQTLQQVLPFEKHSLKSVLESKCPPHKDMDPLFNFIMLRSQQALPLGASPRSAVSPVSDITKQRPHSELQTTGQTHGLERMCLNAAVSGNASREQSRAVSKIISPFTSDLNDQHTQLEIQGSRVVEVQATESQYQAFCEVKSFAEPYLSFAQKLGLDMKAWGNFSSLTMEQTHFLIKQQEKALSRIKSHDVDLVREQKQLQAEVNLIHVLVTFKELLLKCGLSTSVEFLGKINGDEKRFKQLLKRLQIILHLSQKKQETNPKFQELPRLLTTWFNHRRENSMPYKVIVLFTNNSDNTRSSILRCLHQIKGSAVADFHVGKDQMKLNGASVVSRMYHNECALVCEQHLGPDFPWQSFSLVVEYDRPGPSPWATVCREKGLIHVTFNTIVSDTDKSPWSLEDSVPYVLFVTEGLLNCPMLLQTLESMFNITVLERGYCTTLQMLGGIHQYAVITVDESTAIVIQKQEELCQERASEALVMRLTALSLQYRCCWLILHSPDSQGGGLSSEAFSNMTLVYSSLVLFGMKSEDLDVKVLMAWDVLEMAKWISQICFSSLINSDRDPAGYVDREWLTILQTNEEKCLQHFPCINPLVSQLMLKRAPNLQWLLSATLSELKEMLPEVPHKVLKLFTDTTALYTKTTGLNKVESQTGTGESCRPNDPNSPWIGSEGPRYLRLSPVQDPSIPFAIHDNFCDAASTEEPELQLLFKLSASSPDDNQRSWDMKDLWTDDRDEVKAPDWGSSRSREMGKMVSRPDLRLPQHNPSMTSPDSKYNSAFSAESAFSTNCGLPFYNITSPTKAVEWGPGLSPSHTFSSGEGLTRTSVRYGSKSFMGQERKRSGDNETLVGRALTPLKKTKLSYERVPGRSDGQTRLKLF